MSEYKLLAEKRNVFGRKVKRLRGEGKLPANLFGKKIKSLALTLTLSDFEKTFSETGETEIIEINVGKDKYPVLVSNISVDPVNESTLHVDFRLVDLKEKIRASVPLELIGESPAEKSGLGVLVQQLDEVEVEALPGDLPKQIEVDIEKLEEVDQAVFVKDLKYNSSKIKIELDPEQIVAKIEPMQKEEEPEPVPVSEGEEQTPVSEAIEEEKPEEEQTPVSEA